jgi:hypothetical protein
VTVTTRISATLAAASAAAAVLGAPPLDPGAAIGSMRLERVSNDNNVVSIFDFCNPLILAPGVTHRHCTIPRTQRLFIGWGLFEATYPALDRAWRGERWRLVVDGHEVRLARFGTDERTLYNYPPGAGVNSILREWRVALIHPSAGRHRIRYIAYRKGGAVTDVTWTITIRRTSTP